ncbi:hypothetical protein [Calothrix sp. UHCC 0171]|uniref:hypothetical protein n=1 Tax=Calothrix sp. UHCC 0171 TaxID=3110245 RepID=UPI002B21E924|nr:hypothetical protein [Calothrix sp. UHCC 0171]MEA5574486.1 hypothetical protein [Calothrix sp. UHCC 0171]
MAVLIQHQPKSTADNSSTSQEIQALEPYFSQVPALTLLYYPTLAAALKNFGIPHSGEAAVFLNQLAFWLSTDSGHATKDGRKWIYNSYADWTQQITSLSEYQFGSMVRALQELGFIEKSCYAHVRRELVEQSPVAWHTHNTSSWMTLCVERIVELTNWHPFGEEISPSPQQSSESASSTEIANTISQFRNNNSAKLRSQFPSIYKENSISTKNAKTTKEKTYSQELEVSDPWLDEPPNNPIETKNLNNSSTSPKESSEGHFSAPRCNTDNTSNTNRHFTTDSKSNTQLSCATGSTNTTKATNTTGVASITETAQHNVTNSDEIAKPKLKGEETFRLLYVWEDALNRPSEIFLNWWANRHYKPQGGKWETGARSYAYSEFYKNPARTDVLYQEFLQFFDQVANNAHQQQNQDIQSILPSCLVKYPEVNQENKEQVAENIATVAARGAGVAIPGDVSPCSSQHMSLDEAASGGKITPLPNLEKPVLPGTAQPPVIDCSELAKKIAFVYSRWDQVYKGNKRRLQEIALWVRRTEGLILLPDGRPALAPELMEDGEHPQPEQPVSPDDTDAQYGTTIAHGLDQPPVAPQPMEEPSVGLDTQPPVVPQPIEEPSVGLDAQPPVVPQPMKEPSALLDTQPSAVAQQEDEIAIDNNVTKVNEDTIVNCEITEVETISCYLKNIRSCLLCGEYDLLATFLSDLDGSIKSQILSCLTVLERKQLENFDYEFRYRTREQEQGQPVEQRQQIEQLQEQQQPVERRQQIEQLQGQQQPVEQRQQIEQLQGQQQPVEQRQPNQSSHPNTQATPGAMREEPRQIERERSQYLKGCNIPLRVGSKVRCYPTDTHWQNDWTVKAEIIELHQEKGYFNGCTVRYFNPKTQSKVEKFICGGSGDWLLELIE